MSILRTQIDEGFNYLYKDKYPESFTAFKEALTNLNLIQDHFTNELNNKKNKEKESSGIDDVNITSSDSDIIYCRKYLKKMFDSYLAVDNLAILLAGDRIKIRIQEVEENAKRRLNELSEIKSKISHFEDFLTTMSNKLESQSNNIPQKQMIIANNVLTNLIIVQTNITYIQRTNLIVHETNILIQRTNIVFIYETNITIIHKSNVIYVSHTNIPAVDFNISNIIADNQRLLSNLMNDQLNKKDTDQVFDLLASNSLIYSNYMLTEIERRESNIYEMLINLASKVVDIEDKSEISIPEMLSEYSNLVLEKNQELEEKIENIQESVVNRSSGNDKKDIEVINSLIKESLGRMNNSLNELIQSNFNEYKVNLNILSTTNFLTKKSENQKSGFMIFLQIIIIIIFVLIGSGIIYLYVRYKKEIKMDSSKLNIQLDYLENYMNKHDDLKKRKG